MYCISNLLWRGIGDPGGEGRSRYPSVEGVDSVDPGDVESDTLEVVPH